MLGGSHHVSMKSLLKALATVLGAVLIAIPFSANFREAIGPGVEWKFGSVSLGFPAVFVAFFIVYSLPAMAIAPVITRRGSSPASILAGFFGIAIGCWWCIHLSGLDADVANASAQSHGSLVSYHIDSGAPPFRWFVNIEYSLLVHGGVVAGITMFLLPAICGFAAMLTLNYWQKRFR